MSIIICDLDGTLSNHNHRKHLSHVDFDAYNSQLHLDEPNAPIAELIYCMRAIGHTIIFMTGRAEKYFAQTREWLIRNRIHYDDLFMRADGDMRSDTVVKKSMFDKLSSPEKENVLFVLEDRTCVVDMWRSIGLTCLQVENFEPRKEHS